MDSMERLNEICEQIESDPSMTPEEKSEVIREEEASFLAHQAQYEAEQEALQRKYGF